jgi:hypothetical protein
MAMPARREFERLWARVLEDAHAYGVSLGRGSYGGWDDGLGSSVTG